MKFIMLFLRSYLTLNHNVIATRTSQLVITFLYLLRERIRKNSILVLRRNHDVIIHQKILIYSQNLNFRNPTFLMRDDPLKKLFSLLLRTVPLFAVTDLQASPPFAILLPPYLRHTDRAVNGICPPVFFSYNVTQCRAVFDAYLQGTDESTVNGKVISDVNDDGTRSLS